MKCKWCGTPGVLVEGYHASCAEKKENVKQHKVVGKKEKTPARKNHSRNDDWIDHGDYQRRLLEFRQTWAKKGIRI